MKTNTKRALRGWLVVGMLLLFLSWFTYKMDTRIEQFGAGGITIGSAALFWFGWRKKQPITARMMIALIFASVVALVIGFIVDRADATATETEMKALAEYHKGTLRGALFGSFLSLGGFLLSLKTFIVVKIKEGIYDSKRYRKRIAAVRAYEPDNAKSAIFGELDRLRSLLFASIVASIIAGIAQVTVGVKESAYTATVCIAAACFVIALLIQSLILINSNLRDWFKELEFEAVAKERKQAQKKKEQAEKVGTPTALDESDEAAASATLADKASPTYTSSSTG